MVKVTIDLNDKEHSLLKEKAKEDYRDLKSFVKVTVLRSVEGKAHH